MSTAANEATKPEVAARTAVYSEVELVEAIVQMLRAEASRKNFGIVFYPSEVRYSERGLIILPVTTDETRPIREESRMQTALENVWNEQEPPPLRRVHLDYLWNPEISIRSTPPPLLNQTV